MNQESRGKREWMSVFLMLALAVTGAVSSLREATAAEGPSRKELCEMLIAEIQYRDADVRDVLHHLSKITEVPIILDKDTSFSEKGERGTISPEVNILLRDIRFIDGLDVILRSKGLGYRVEKNHIWVTKVENLAKGEGKQIEVASQEEKSW